MLCHVLRVIERPHRSGGLMGLIVRVLPQDRFSADVAILAVKVKLPAMRGRQALLARCEVPIIRMYLV